MKFFFYAGVCFIGLAAGLSGLSAMSENEFYARALQVEAVVDRVDQTQRSRQVTTNDGRRSPDNRHFDRRRESYTVTETIFNARLRFMTGEGREVEARLQMGTAPRYEAGDRAWIFYDPRNPTDIRDGVSYAQAQRVTRMSKGLGVLFGVLVILIVLKMLLLPAPRAPQRVAPRASPGGPPSHGQIGA